jgi:hypothetical protein
MNNLMQLLKDKDRQHWRSIYGYAAQLKSLYTWMNFF